MRPKFTIPHNLVIVFSIIIIAAVMTWIIPGGKYDRLTVKVNGVERSVIVNGSFHHVESQPQTWQIFSAGKKPGETAKLFVEGVKDIVSASLVVGFAGGIIAVLTDGQIIDSILFSLSGALKGAGQMSAVPLCMDFSRL